ncbi:MULTISPECIES: hypothetical protein [Dyella]|uniref:Uncharacterized protein n=2 Tax=Dyella TaxID=231454 RepID=A0A4R0YIB8_9GAMM|nr:MULTISPECIES: hypothetical protein [Dyella]TBR36729.1 hypothetical protein EYV96_12495 [Dyella terrae]TCI08180.1 hypothetical protein EZM97_26375 [Dyella soli]
MAMILLIFHVTAIAQGAAKEVALGALAEAAYKQYAWVAVFGTTQPAGSVPLALESQVKLKEIFASDLARALKEDSQCAERSQEVCKIDFDILYDSQDPFAADLAFKLAPDGGSVEACFKDASGNQQCLTLVGGCDQGRERIADIIYPGHASLRQTLGLSQKPKGESCSNRRI